MYWWINFGAPPRGHCGPVLGCTRRGLRSTSSWTAAGGVVSSISGSEITSSIPLCTLAWPRRWLARPWAVVAARPVPPAALPLCGGRAGASGRVGGAYAARCGWRRAESCAADGHHRYGLRLQARHRSGPRRHAYHRPLQPTEVTCPTSALRASRRAERGRAYGATNHPHDQHRIHSSACGRWEPAATPEHVIQGHWSPATFAVQRREPSGAASAAHTPGHHTPPASWNTHHLREATGHRGRWTLQRQRGLGP